MCCQMESRKVHLSYSLNSIFKKIVPIVASLIEITVLLSFFIDTVVLEAVKLQISFTSRV